MVARPTYNTLKRKIKKLEKEALDYMRKEQEFSKERKLNVSGHMRRTISLMKINEELNREIDEIKRAYKEELKQVSDKLRGRIKELNCLYDIPTRISDQILILDVHPNPVLGNRVKHPAAFLHPGINRHRRFGKHK